MTDVAKRAVLECDVCGRTEIETPITTWRLTRPGRAGTFDLCEEHSEVFEEWFTRYGRPKRQPSIRRSPNP